MANPVIQFKRGVLANLPGLQAGEPGFTTDSYDLYVGINSTTGENKIVGSHRFWTNNTSSTGSGVNLVEGTSNGTSYITLKSPDSLAGITTYTFPATATDGYFLKTNSSGVLSWDQVVSNINIAADSGSPDSVSTGATITFAGGEGIDTTVTDNTITIAAELASDTNKGVASFDATDFQVISGAVGLSTERIQDIAGAMVTGNTETLITVTYQDADGTIDFVVDNDLANYSNTNSAFITAASSDTLTNKTFNANGTGNSLSNVEVADFAASAIVTEAEGLNSSDNDTSLPTTAAVKNYVDSVDLTVSTAGDSGTGSVSTSQTLTVSGTANEIETTASGQSITIGLPNNVSIAGTLTVDRIDVNQISPDGSDFGTTDYVPVANGSGGWSWQPVTAAGAGVLDGISVSDTNGTVGTAGSITNIKFTDNLVVTGTAGGNIATVSVSSTPTFTSVVFGSGTAITSVDTDISSVSASDDTLASAKAIKTYVDSQVTAQDLDIQGDTGGALSIDLDSETLTISGTANEIETSGAGNTITIGLPDDVVIGAGLTVTGALDVNGGGSIDNVQIGVSGDNEIDTSSGNLTIDSAGGTTTIDDNLSVTGVSTFTGAIDANGGADISGGETTLSSATVSDLTSGRVVLAGTSGALEDSANLTFGASGLIVGANGINVTGFSTFSTDVNIGGDLTVGGNDIKASDGTTALTLADSTGAVTAASDLTVQGNLYVSGNTTQVNTAALTVEDRTIDLGIVNGAAPASATTWDLGILFNYNSSGAKKSAVIWEHADTRFKFASVLGADTNGTDNNTPQLTVTTFAPIEIGALWVNDCAGQSQVISCTGSERFLENITVDAGTF